MKPWPLAKAEFIDSLCQRWGCPPSALMREDADLVFGMLAILAARGPSGQ